jgi:hypothetical protein
LFRALGEHDFRLLLCASRVSQPSLEFESERGTLFSRCLIDVISGKVTVGNRRGVVYFSDLYQYLVVTIGEVLEERGLSRITQQPVFAGTYSGDPLLFVPRDSTVREVEAESLLYSRRHLLRLVRQGITYDDVDIRSRLVCLLLLP